jgi:hypothetical protein
VLPEGIPVGDATEANCYTSVQPGTAAFVQVIARLDEVLISS